MERNVVVAGWGQIKQPKKIQTPALDLMGLMVEACRQAEEKTQSKKVLSSIQGIMVVTPGSQNIETPARLLADKLEATPRFKTDSGIGGNSPQTLINKAAGMIARNEIDSVLIAGAECYVQRENSPQKVESALFKGVSPNYTGDDLIGSTHLENQHGIEHPMHGFPLFETALWASSKKNLPAYLKNVGKMWAAFSKVAATNPHAWTNKIKDWEEIITPGPANRPIAFPYTKYMNAFVTVDQGAAVILMAEETARKFKQKQRQTVYFTGGGYAQDRQRFLIEKSDFTASPPLKAAVNKALNRSGMLLKDIENLDIYSCFPCAVSIAKKMIGLKNNDPRSLTQTGGLGFFGGPGNNYNLHAVTTLAEKISTGETSNGLVTALGWFLHKHAAGVYSCQPSKHAFQNHDLEDKKNPLVGEAPMLIKNDITGTGTIETYTIVYNIDHTPEYAVIYGRTEDNHRFIANTENCLDTFNELSMNCCVGKKVRLRKNTAKNINIAELI